MRVILGHTQNDVRIFAMTIFMSKGFTQLHLLSVRLPIGTLRGRKFFGCLIIVQ